MTTFDTYGRSFKLYSMTTRPSIDHGLLSPSGRVSERTRKAVLKREHDRLFPPGYWDAPAKTETEVAHEKAETLRRTAATLRDLAAQGMKPRAYLKAAADFEAKAGWLERHIHNTGEYATNSKD